MNTAAYKFTAIVLLILNLALAGAIWILEPGSLLVALAGGLVLPALFAATVLARRVAPRVCACSGGGALYEHLAVGALMITTALLVALTDIADLTTGDTGERMTGAMLGMLVVFFGNRIPRESRCQSDDPQTAGRQQRVQRGVGYIMVVAGLLMSASWIVLPEHLAPVAFIGIGVSALIATGVLCITNKRTQGVVA